ncbi:MAG: hypothetical protein FJ304_25265 [Planctomycetes bacterium]|nr:hypothetical protein [Planctomycetota bacterium]
MTANPRARWAEVLNARADAGPDAAVSAFLRALPADGFLPPAEKAAAVNALAGTDLPVGKDYDADELLREEVRAFAANFWAVPPAERLTAWADLSRRVTGERSAAALLALEPGLDVPADPLPDPGAEELAALARALFVLPPRERAIRRNEWLAVRASDGALWPQVIAAFAELRRLAPARAALDPQLGVTLTATFDRAALYAGHTTTTRPESEATAADRARVAMKMRDYKERVAARNGDSRTLDECDSANAKRVYFWGIAIAFVVVLSMCVSSSCGKRSTPATRLDIPKNIDGFPRTTFTPEQIESYQHYERETEAGREPRIPSGYANWVRAGRPSATANVPRANQSVTFTVSEIYACTDYDRARIGTAPAKYSFWVLLNKPTTAGTFFFPTP